jgi:hypothetical protein
MGGFLSGFAAARQNRIDDKKQKDRDATMKAILTAKAKPADGLGATPVTASGAAAPSLSDVKESPGAVTTGPNKPKSLLSKIGGYLFPGFKDGGRITKSGLAYVHKGESIISAKQSTERKTLRSSVRKSSRR